MPPQRRGGYEDPASVGWGGGGQGQQQQHTQGEYGDYYGRSGGYYQGPQGSGDASRLQENVRVREKGGAYGIRSARQRGSRPTTCLGGDGTSLFWPCGTGFVLCCF